MQKKALEKVKAEEDREVAGSEEWEVYVTFSHSIPILTEYSMPIQHLL